MCSFCLQYFSCHPPFQSLSSNFRPLFNNPSKHPLPNNHKPTFQFSLFNTTPHSPNLTIQTHPSTPHSWTHRPVGHLSALLNHLTQPPSNSTLRLTPLFFFEPPSSQTPSPPSLSNSPPPPSQTPSPPPSQTPPPPPSQTPPPSSLSNPSLFPLKLPPPPPSQTPPLLFLKLPPPSLSNLPSSQTPHPSNPPHHPSNPPHHPSNHSHHPSNPPHHPSNSPYPSQLDNRGGRVISNDINVPAIAAAHTVRNHVARNHDELSINVRMGGVMSCGRKNYDEEMREEGWRSYVWGFLGGLILGRKSLG